MSAYHMIVFKMEKETESYIMIFFSSLNGSRTGNGLAVVGICQLGTDKESAALFQVQPMVFRFSGRRSPNTIFSAKLSVEMQGVLVYDKRKCIREERNGFYGRRKSGFSIVFL